MAKWTHAITTLTPTAFADTTNMTDATYVGVVQGGSSTQLLKHTDILLTGQAPSTSSPTLMLLSRDSTVAATVSLGTGETNAATNAATAALAAPQVVGNTATTKPQRSSTLHNANLSINAYGGGLRWQSPDPDGFTSVGNTASLGEFSLSAFTGGTPGLIGAQWVYETI